MNVSSWAIRNPVAPIALFLVLTIIGIMSFVQLPVTRFPNVDIPVVSVSIAQVGASPSELVSSVTKPLEEALASINGVRNISSTVSDSLSNTTLQFEMETPLDQAVNDVTARVSQIRTSLPQDIEQPVVSKVDYTALPIITFAVQDSTKSIEDLSDFVDKVVIQKLQSLSSVGHVTRKGGAEKAVTVSLHPAALSALGITVADVNSQLENRNVDLSAGRGHMAGQELSLRALGSVSSIEALRETSLSLPDGKTVKLGAIARITEGHAEARSFAMLNGQPVVAFSIFRAIGVSDVVAADDASSVLADLKNQHTNIKFAQIEDASIYTLSSYDSAIETLIEGALLAVVVVFLFLRNWRATIVTAVALPLSIIPTFFVMNWLGFSLNTVSLLGITLVTGILVDDAIVEIENIVRHIRGGSSAYRAAQEASQEIGTTVVAISLTIVAVFVPVSFMSGLAGQYFRQFGLTVAVAVLFSLLVVRLLTPMMSAYFLKSATTKEEIEDGTLMRGYLRILGWTLRHRAVTLTLGLAVFAGSIYSASFLQTTLIPNADESRTNMAVTLPPGTTLDQTFASAREISNKLLGETDVRRVFVSAGEESVNAANFSIYYSDRSQRTLSSQELDARLPALLADIPDVRLTVLGSGEAQPLSISVLGDDPKATVSAALALAEQMSSAKSIKNITTSAALSQPELRIIVRPEKSAQLGVSTRDLALTISTATLGGLEATQPKYSTNGDQIPIVVRLDKTARFNLDLLRSIPVPTQSGSTVPLSAVAKIVRGTSPSIVTRYNQQSLVTISADFVGNAVLGTAIKEVSQLPLAKAMPAGTRFQPAADADAMKRVFSNFALAMGVGLLLVYVVLVLLFNSFLTPVTIILSLPLSVGGAILALYITGNPISLPVLIGFLMLMGIVTKNAIMLVEFALVSMASGRSKAEAVIDAAHKRARPIVMTTIAMVAGMVPSALAFGLGGEFRAPMAIAVIGGLLVSTLLSLLFVPSLFSAIDGFGKRSSGLLGRLLGFDVDAASSQQ